MSAVTMEEEIFTDYEKCLLMENTKISQRDKTMTTVKELCNITLYDFITNNSHFDFKKFEDFCVENIDYLDMNIVYRVPPQLNKLRFIFRRIYAMAVTRQKLRSDPYFPASSTSPNVCNLS